MAALREGVIERMELQIGMPVKKGGSIGVLHHEIAELTVAKNQLQAKAIAPEEKAKAQEDVAASVCPQQAAQRPQAGHGLGRRDGQAEGEMKVADAARHEADENREIAKAELRPGRADPRGAHDRRPVRRGRHQAA